MAAHVRRGIQLPIVQKAWKLNAVKGVDHLIIDSQASMPLLASPNQVLVKVKAASVNPVDVMMASGYGRRVFDMLSNIETQMLGLHTNPHSSIVLGRDFSGEVVALGANVRHLKVGDDVWGAVYPSVKQGSHQEYIAVNSSSVTPKPSSLSHLQSSSIPYAALTAWAAITTFAGLSKTRHRRPRVLVFGAAGGVGGFAVDLLSSHFQAEVSAVVSSDAVDEVTKRGIKNVLDYKSNDYARKLSELPKQDVIIDCAGLGTNTETTKELLPLLRDHGRFVSLSSPLLANTDKSGLIPGFAISLFELSYRNSCSVRHGKTVRWAYFMPNQSALWTIRRLIDTGKLHVPVINSFPMAQTIEAYKKVEAGHLRGKIVVDIAS